MSITTTACVAVALAACWCDLRTRRVPNLLTFGAAAAAILVRIATEGPNGAFAAMTGAGVGMLFFFPLFALRGMGAGDLKLMGAIGAWLGLPGALWAGIYASIAGGVLALAVALASGYLRTAVRNIWTLLGYWRLAGVRPLDSLTLSSSPGPRLPYALPIAAGALLAVWLR